MKAKCKEILDRLNPLDQDAINAAIEEREKLAGSMSPQERAKLADGAVSDHLANLRSERKSIMGQVTKDEPTAAEKAAERERAKAVKKESRRVDIQLFTVLKGHETLPAIADDPDEQFTEKVTALARQWVAEQQAESPDAIRKSVLDAYALPPEMVASLRREAKKAAAEIAKQRKADENENKLRNTGVDLRRHWELLKAELKAKDAAEGITAMNRIFTATTRADLFAGIVPESATPAAKMYVERVRDAVLPFKEWLVRKAGLDDALNGVSDYRAGPAKKIEEFIRGEAYVHGVPGDEAGRKGRYQRFAADFMPGLGAEKRSDTNATTQERVDALRNAADEYLDLVRQVTAMVSGVTTSKEAVERVSKALWQEGKALQQPKPGEWVSHYSALSPERASPLGNELREKGIIDHEDGWRLSMANSNTAKLVRDEASIKAEDHQRKKPLLPPRLTEIVREGRPGFRKGNVTPQQFKEHFGFADIGFGSWVTSGEDQAHLNNAYDAFADLADHLGIDPKHIGFGGRLHFTLGALGHGSKAAATFHPAHPGPEGIVQVINLTKTKGDGTVAHEWFHALDHFLRQDRLSGAELNTLVRALSQRRASFDELRSAAINGLRGHSWMQGHKRDGVLENAARLVDYHAWRNPIKTEYKRNADFMDPNYWGTPHELLARAFESWVHDTLQGSNNYLVNPWVADGVTTTPAYKGTPFPRGEERKTFAAWFKALVGSLQYNDKGMPTIDGEKFDALAPEKEEDYRRMIEDLKASLPALQSQLVMEAEAKVEADRAKAEEQRRAEREMQQAAQREYEAVHKPPETPPAGELDTPDLEALFDQAADSARAEAHENVTAPDPGEPALDPATPPALPKYTAPKVEAPAEPQVKGASELIKEAAKLGVKGVDEALTGLTKLFGAGKIQSFPGGFDEDTYRQAKPHFEAALKAFQEAGKTLVDLFKLLIQQFGEGVKPYAIRFAKDMNLTSDLGKKPSATKSIAEWVKGELNRPGAAPAAMITSNALFQKATEAFGGTQAEGKYTPKDAYDAAEAGMNMHILDTPAYGRPADAAQARAVVALLKSKTALLPTATKRTGEQDEFQQFSTVPALAYLANWTANIQPGELMGEPSAGVGGLASFARRAGATLVLNELSSRRAEILAEVLPGAQIHHENAEQIANVLPPEIRPTVVVMNPPFSATAGRMEGTRDTMVGAKHIESALAWLRPGGRLVAIVGKGMAEGEPRFAPWWKGIKERYSVRAILSLNGEEYAKYGTTYDNVLLVIDKTGPTTGAVITGRAEAYSEVPALLEGVRNDRKQPSAADRAPEQPADQQSGGETLAPDLGQPGQPQRPDVGGMGGERGDLPGTGGSRGGAGGEGTRGGDGVRDAGTGRQRGNPPGRARLPEPGGGGEPAAGGDLGSNERVALDGAALEKRNNELTEAVFEAYTPLKARVKGSQPHPGKLVESAAMAAVDPQDATYAPNLPREAIERGRVSDAQLEAVIYAGQAHSKHLPNGNRGGYFVGDGTGVGKGREIAAIILDNQRQGRKKALWISAASGLVNDARRDYGGVVGKPGESVTEIFELRKVSEGGADPKGKITRKDGIAFLTYDTLKGGEKAQGTAKDTAQTTLKQLIEWLGIDFDGVIAFDESHKIKNLGGQKGPRGKTKPSQRAIVAQELRDAFPQARIVYVSATGATEVANLAYTDRLGLWGPQTSFTDANDFAAKIGAAGLAAMELVARDMKSMGAYISRSLSYDGVEQEMIDATFSPLQKEIYDELARAWQIILKDVGAALKTTEQAKNGQAKSAALSAFWSTQQRFFNQVITAMMTPYAIDKAQAKIADGHAVLFQLVNTNEATQERLIEAADAQEIPLEELDFTPKQTLIEYLRKSFPVVAYEEYVDDNGNRRSRPAVDSEGKPVISREAEERRDALIEHIDKNLRVPENPIDLIYEALGEKEVGEVSGRGRRFQKVMGQDGSIKLEERKRTGKSNRADAEAFMGDKKKVLIFTDAGGTGFSFHSDKGAKNQRRRFHILLQPGWVAENAMQGIGRSHRSNEVNQPIVALPRSDLKAQKRFISSIARRLDQLGALTKGQRNTTSQGLFTNRDNLESKYAKAALRSLLEDMAPGQKAVENAEELISAMGLDGVYDENGSIAESKMPTMQRFLNRMLSLTTKQQDQLFTEFEMRMDAAIDAAIQNGTYDDGMQTLKALKVHKLRDELVHVDEKTKAGTRYIELELTQPTLLNDWARAQNLLQLYSGKGYEYYQDTVSNKPFLVVNLGERMDGKGRLEHRGYRLDVTAPSKTSRGRYVGDRDKYERGGDWRTVKRDEGGKLVHVPPSAYEDRQVAKSLTRYVKISPSEAEYLWGESVEEQPKTYTENMHLLTGALLPVWDRINVDSEKTVAVVRTQTDDGERLIGRVISEDDRAAILRNLGVGAVRADMPAQEIMDRIMRGESAKLANGWLLRRVKVANEPRIEIIASYLSPGEKRILAEQGAILERIAFQERVFVPTTEDAFNALTRGSNRPVVDFISPQTSSFSENLREEPPQAAAPREKREKGVPLKQLRDSVAATIGADLPADAFVARPLPDGLAPAVAAIERAWGVKVVPFVNNNPEIIDINGVHTSSGNTLYVNVEAQYPLLQIVGHELLHEMSRRAPDLYAALRDRVEPLLKNRAGYAALRVNKVHRGDPDRVTEEMIADLVGENFRQRGFWRALAEKDPSLAQRIVDWVVDFIDRTLQVIRGTYRAEMYVSDLEAARAAVVEGMANFAAEPDAQAEGDLSFSAATPPVWYSELAKQVAASKTGSASPEQWAATLKGMKGVKAEELEFSGVLGWLGKREGRVGRGEITAFLRKHGVRVEETMMGGAKTAARKEREQEQFDLLTAEYARYMEANPGVRDMGDATEALLETNVQIAQLKDRIGPRLRTAMTAEEKAELEALEERSRYLVRFNSRWEEVGTPRARAHQIVVLLDQMGYSLEYDPAEGTIMTLIDREGRRFIAYHEDEEAGGNNRIDNEYPFDDLSAEVQGLVAEHSQIVTTDLDAEVGEDAPYENYTLPGGENYRVLLLHTPVKRDIVARHEMGEPERLTPAEATQRLGMDLEDDYSSLGTLDAVLVYPRAANAYILALKDGRYFVPTVNGDRTFTQLKPAEDFLYHKQLVPEAGWQPDSNFRSSHFQKPNVLAHVRLKDRTDPEGRKVLFIEEIQSDWAQQGKRKGFGPPASARYEKAKAKAVEKFKAANISLDVLYGGGSNRADQLNLREWKGERYIHPESLSADLKGVYDELQHLNQMAAEARASGDNPIPAGPFVQKTESWVALVLKRAIRYAAENGYDAIAWTTGRQQADRYSLRHQVESISWEHTGDGTPIRRGSDYIGVVVRLPGGMRQVTMDVSMDGKILDATGGSRHLEETLAGKKLEEVLGKTAAEKILGEPSGRLEGEGLNIGGEGMISFYDRILPGVANDVLKKMGGGRVREIMPEIGGPRAFVRTEYTGRGRKFHVQLERHRATPETILVTADEDEAILRARTYNDANQTMGQMGFDVDRERGAAPMPMFSMADQVRRGVVNRTNDLVRSSRQFSWWDRTVGTQLHKATKNPWFRRVFDRGQQYLQDVSEFASRAMDEAPNILLKLEKLSDVVKMGAKPEDLKKIGRVIFNETLERQFMDPEALAAELTPDQVRYYHEARRAINRSLTDLAASEYVRKTRNMGMETAHQQIRENPDDAPQIITDAMMERLRILRVRAHQYARDPHMAGALQTVRDQIDVMDTTLTEIKQAIEKIAMLRNQAYAPLMRFGKYSVHVFHESETGGTVTDYFGLYETEREANAAARELKAEFGDSYVEQGIMSQEAWKVFRGVSPDTLEVFAEALGVAEAPVFQQYLKLAVNNRSALKRLIKRKGTAGFSWDTSRVLASFITSNARRASGNWHFADMLQDVAEIPRDEGDVKDEAVRLVEYLQNPQEEAAGLRGFLFAQFLGGSVAAAMVNLTQPLLMTFPYLQRFGATPASMLRAARVATGKPAAGTPLAAAMEKAAQDGVIAPNEIHQLYAEAIRSLGSNIWVRRAMRVWGSLFAVSEAFNRRLTFAAAFEAATAKGLEQPYEFAVRAVQETQGIYNRGNRPNWARGAVGATIFTFKQFSIAYLEFLARLPKEQKVLALGILVIAAGLQGLPFADDLDDLIDTLGQSLGYNTNAKRWKRRALEDALGQTGAAFVLQGFSSLPGMPLDVQARLGVGNLIPGTSAFKRSEVDKSRDVLEVMGPAGSLVQSAVKAFGKAQHGELAGAAGQMAPLAIVNALKAAEMAQMGIYRDTRGRRVVDVDKYDSAVKAIGFQPRNVAQESRRAQELQQMVAMAKVVEGDIAETWAQGIFEKDPAKIEAARKDLLAWNQKNPESRILIAPIQIQRRVQEMRKTREQRAIKAAPRELRGTVQKDFQR